MVDYGGVLRFNFLEGNSKDEERIRTGRQGTQEFGL